MRIYLELLRFHFRRKIFMLLPNSARLRMLRADGVRIGENCLVHTPLFSVEPYLIEIGNHVAISAGTEFVTHDAVGWLFTDHPNMGIFGTIKVGDNVFFGLKCLILPGTRIGSNCVIGAGAVVRGVIPDNSVVMGNPGKVVMQTPLLKKMLIHSRGRLETHMYDSEQKKRALLKHFGIE